MAEQAGHGDGHGGAPPGRDPGLPDGAARAPGRDAHLPGFAKGGEWDACPPSAALALALEAASGPGWRCPGASREEMFGLLRQWQALESRAAAAKLGIVRALIRDDDQPLPGGAYHGDLPGGWTRSLTHDVALALAMPAVSAERLMWLAWDLQGRLPGTGGLLAAGVLTTSKAQAVDEALQQLSSQDAAAAEALILADLPGKTYGQVARLAARAAVTVDPDSAARRRQDAERNKSRVEMFREQSGAAGLAGRDMPTDQALAAHASVCARAQEYKESGAFPGGTRMDQYRAAAYLDLLNGITAGARIATGLLPGACPAGDPRAGGPAPAGGTALAVSATAAACRPTTVTMTRTRKTRTAVTRTADRPAPKGRPTVQALAPVTRTAATPTAVAAATAPAAASRTAAPALTPMESHARRRLQLPRLVPHGWRTWCSP